MSAALALAPAALQLEGTSMHLQQAASKRQAVFATIRVTIIICQALYVAPGCSHIYMHVIL
jgi:hypothetical protein